MKTKLIDSRDTLGRPQLRPMTLLFGFVLSITPLILMGSGCSSNQAETNELASVPTYREDNSMPLSLRKWHSQMLVFGKTYCNKDQIREHQTWEGGVWYYDGSRVFFQMADFTGDPAWSTCAEHVIDVYRNYVLKNKGRVPGWRVFPHGLAQHYLRKGDRKSREAVLLLAQNSAFAHKAGGADPELSRETAYLIHANLLAQEFGLSSSSAALRDGLEYALDHLRAWTVDSSTEYVKPFMLALTLEALIAYHDKTDDARIPPAVQNAADWLWKNGWRPNEQAFPYIICKPGAAHEECPSSKHGSAPDLNLLIAPAYAWLYFNSGDERYGSQADEIFAGGVIQADLDNGKRFSQNYRWSPSYLHWRYGLRSEDSL